MAGGASTVVATIPAAAGRGITGLTCQGSVCLVSTTSALPPAKGIWSVSLATGATTELATGVDGFPRLSPVSGDLVARNVTGIVETIPGVPRELGSLFVFHGLLP